MMFRLFFNPQESLHPLLIYTPHRWIVGEWQPKLGKFMPVSKHHSEESAYQHLRSLIAEWGT